MCCVRWLYIYIALYVKQYAMVHELLCCFNVFQWATSNRKIKEEITFYRAFTLVRAAKSQWENVNAPNTRNLGITLDLFVFRFVNDGSQRLWV